MQAQVPPVVVAVVVEAVVVVVEAVVAVVVVAEAVVAVVSPQMHTAGQA